jgi:hypothetical protein
VPINPYVPNSNEVQQKIREMEEHLGTRKRKKPAPSPGAATERYPGDPYFEIGDITIASRRRRRDSSTGTA